MPASSKICLLRAKAFAILISMHLPLFILHILAFWVITSLHRNLFQSANVFPWALIKLAHLKPVFCPIISPSTSLISGFQTMGMYIRAYASFLHLHTIPFLIPCHAFIIPTTHILCVHPWYLGRISDTNPQKALLGQLPPCLGNHIFHLRRQRIFQGYFCKFCQKSRVS